MDFTVESLGVSPPSAGAAVGPGLKEGRGGPSGGAAEPLPGPGAALQTGVDAGKDSPRWLTAPERSLVLQLFLFF